MGGKVGSPKLMAEDWQTVWEEGGMALSCFLWPDTCCHSPLILRLLAAPGLAPWPCLGLEEGR